MNIDSIEAASQDRGLWTKAQRQVFEDSLDGHRLIDIVNGWTAPTEDATNLDRKILHVPRSRLQLPHSYCRTSSSWSVRKSRQWQ